MTEVAKRKMRTNYTSRKVHRLVMHIHLLVPWQMLNIKLIELSIN